MKAFYQDNKVKLYQADVLEWALAHKKKIDKGAALPFHAIVTDPPYGLGAPPPIEKLLRHWLDNKDYNTGAGFMSNRWDCVVHPRYWRALLDIVFPGGYLFAFSGTRTADLMSIAARLGGWEPFDRVTNFMYCYGSGFPKSHNLSIALDKEAGAERKAVGWKIEPDGRVMGLEPQASARVCNPDDKQDRKFGADNRTLAERKVVTAPATPLAQAFDGYGTTLKPSGEPILLFRKPRAGRTFAQCARHLGSGGLNIEAARVATTDELQTLVNDTQERDLMGAMKGKDITGRKIEYREPGNGRWPPNTHFTHVPPTGPCQDCQGDGCDTCHGRGVIGVCQRIGSKRVKSSGGREKHNRASIGYGGSDVEFATQGYADPDGKEQVADWRCVEDCAVRLLDEQAGERRSGGKPGVKYNTECDATFGNIGRGGSGRCIADAGSASRFFPNHDWSLEIAERLAGETPFRYCAKASRGERDAGLVHLPLKDNHTTYGDFAGTSEHATNVQGQHHNTHSCVKPLSLIKWLATLCKPPTQFKPRICVPYAGSGSEIIGAMLADWTEIYAIERELEYCEIAAARIAWWAKWQNLTRQDDPAKIRALAQVTEKHTEQRGDERQTNLFDAMGLE